MEGTRSEVLAGMIREIDRGDFAFTIKELYSLKTEELCILTEKLHGIVKRLFAGYVKDFKEEIRDRLLIEEWMALYEGKYSSMSDPSLRKVIRVFRNTLSHKSLIEKAPSGLSQEEILEKVKEILSCNDISTLDKEGLIRIGGCLASLKKRRVLINLPERVGQIKEVWDQLAKFRASKTSFSRDFLTEALIALREVYRGRNDKDMVYLVKLPESVQLKCLKEVETNLVRACYSAGRLDLVPNTELMRLVIKKDISVHFSDYKKVDTTTSMAKKRLRLTEEELALLI